MSIPWAVLPEQLMEVPDEQPAEHKGIRGRQLFTSLTQGHSSGIAVPISRKIASGVTP